MIKYFPAVAAAFFLAALPVRAQLYVTDEGSNSIGTYNPSSGASLNSSFITGLNTPYSIATSAAGNIYVLNEGNGFNTSIGEYTSTGGTVNASLITGVGFGDGQSMTISGSYIFVATDYNQEVVAYDLNGNQLQVNPYANAQNGDGELFDTEAAAIGIAVSGSTYYVLDTSGNVEEWTTSGSLSTSSTATFVGNIVSGLSGFGHADLLLSGSDLFISNGSDTVSEYTTGGTLITTITGLNQVRGLAVSGSTLYIADGGDSQIETYNLSTDTVINSDFITSNGWGLLVATPEPPVWSLLGVALALGWAWKTAARRRLA